MKKEDPSVKPIGKSALLELDALVPATSNREIRKDADLKGLATSIAEVGLIYPIVVKADPDHDGHYRIIAGERRWRALKLLKKESAPCVILSNKEEDGRAEVMRVVENHQRKNLEPLEEAAAVRALLDGGLEPETVARSLGRSRAWVARRSSLTELSDDWLKEIRDCEGKISIWPPSHLEVVARFPQEVQNRMLENWRGSWRSHVPSVRDLEEVTGRFFRQLSAAPWTMEDATLCPRAGTCSTCPKRSSRIPDLFPDEIPDAEGRPLSGDQCLDPQCWEAKAVAFVKRRAEELRREHPNLILLNGANHVEAGRAKSALGSGAIVEPWEAVACKKGDKGAKPALVVHGPGLGKLKWVQLTDEESPARKGRTRDAQSQVGGPPPEKTLEMKREAYDKRRRQVVIDAVKAKLEAIAVETDPEKVLSLEGGPALVGGAFIVKTLCLLNALLNSQGWRRRIQDGGFRMPDDLPWDMIQSWDGALADKKELGPKDKLKLLYGVCWELLQTAIPVWASRLTLTGGDRDNDLHYAEAGRICAMLGFDLSNLRAEAAGAIPYAKAWAKEVTDDWAATRPTTPDGLQAGRDGAKESSEQDESAPDQTGPQSESESISESESPNPVRKTRRRKRERPKRFRARARKDSRHTPRAAR